MKQNILKIMLLASLLLAACSKQNNGPQVNNVSGDNTEENNIMSPNMETIPIHEERLSYQEYVKKYEENPTDINTNQISNEQDNNNVTQKEENYTNNTNEEEQMLATYSTPLLSSSDERINNIEIVCERLNNYILQPNETFSYNNVTGPFGPSDGFEEAPILLSDGTKKDGYGGGVCQLSSTLYNVVKNIKDVKITERHHHSVPVSYVPKGEDATVSLQSNLDFKFINNTNYPIKFKASCNNKNVTVWAYKAI